MKNLVLAVLAALFLSSVQAHAQDKIGYVNIDAVMAGLPDMQAAETKVQKAFTAETKAISQKEAQIRALVDKRERDAATMTQEQIKDLENQILKAQQEYTQTATSLQRDMQQMMEVERQKILKKIMKAVEAVRAEQNYTVIVEARTLLAADTARDVTERVLAKAKTLP